MRQVKRRSALPVYIAAAAFAVRALVLPLYTLWHFFTAALATAAIWLVMDRLVKPKTEYIPEPEPEPVSYGPEADTVLSEAKKARAEMEKLAASIPDAAVQAKIAQLAVLSDRIAQDALQDKADIPRIQKFQSYFLPSTIGLLHAYDRMSAQGIEGENIDRTKTSIAQMLESEIRAFQKQLDALYQNDALDVDAEIRVMRQLLSREGLGDDDGLQELLRKASGKNDGKEAHT